MTKSPNLPLMQVAPHPILARLHRLDHRMLLRMRMLRRVPVLRRIAATHVAALNAQAQVNPGIAGLQAVFTAAQSVRLRDVGGNVVAGFDGHEATPL